MRAAGWRVTDAAAAGSVGAHRLHLAGALSGRRRGSPPRPQLGARHLTTRPYRPRTNGKAERFIQTALREWL
jgi:transposase InsO family protein